MYVILYLLFEGDYIMNDIDKIKLDVINNKLEYDELLELYIKYNDKLDNDHLYKVAVFQEILPEPDFHFSRLNGNGLWSCKNGIGGEIEKGNKPVAGFAYKLIKVLDINK